MSAEIRAAIAAIMRGAIAENASRSSWTAAQWHTYWQESVTTYRPITGAEIMDWSAEENRYSKIEDVTLNKLHPLYSPAKVLLRMMDSATAYLDPNSAAHAALMQGFIAAGVFTEADRTALLAKGEQQEPRWQAMQWPDAHTGDFAHLIDTKAV